LPIAAPVDHLLGRDAAGVHLLLVLEIAMIGRQLAYRHELRADGAQLNCAGQHLADILARQRV
jgi:hypothetical protein